MHVMYISYIYNATDCLEGAQQMHKTKSQRLNMIPDPKPVTDCLEGAQRIVRTHVNIA